MSSTQRSPRIFWFATKGSGTNDALRIDTLLSKFEDRKEIPFSKKGKMAGLVKIMRTISAEKPDLIVMEGTGISGGVACLYGKLCHGVPYVFSSGDAVGPFMRSHHRVAGFAFELYERLLCRFSAGFIGWTPYLCGRAMTFGAPRAVTAAGWPLGGNLRLRTWLRTEKRCARNSAFRRRLLLWELLALWNGMRGGNIVMDGIWSSARIA